MAILGWHGLRQMHADEELVEALAGLSSGAWHLLRGGLMALSAPALVTAAPVLDQFSIRLTGKTVLL